MRTCRWFVALATGVALVKGCACDGQPSDANNDGIWDAAEEEVDESGGEVTVVGTDGIMATVTFGAGAFVTATTVRAFFSGPVGTFAGEVPGATSVIHVSMSEEPAEPYKIKLQWPLDNPPGFAGGPITFLLNEDLSTASGVVQTFDGRDSTATVEWTTSESAIATATVTTGNVLGITAKVNGDPLVPAVVEPGDTVTVGVVAYDPLDNSCADISYPADGPPAFGGATCTVVTDACLESIEIPPATVEFDNTYDSGCEVEFEAECVGVSDGGGPIITCNFAMDHFTVPLGDNLVARVSDYSALAIPALTAPGNGAPGPTEPGPVASIDNLEFTEIMFKFAPRTIAQLASSAPGPFGIVGPFFIAGGTRAVEIPLPPGTPAPPPGTPLPTVDSSVVVVFDALGEELRTLALGDASGTSVSAAVLSHVDAGGSSQLQQAASRTDVLVSYGSISLVMTGWNSQIGDFGMSEVLPQVTNVTDVSPYNGDPESGGAVIAWFAGQRLLFLEYDPSIQLFTTAPGAEVTSAQFAGASGGPVSAFRWQAGGQTLFVTDGQPGELWSHPGGIANAAKIGNLGNGPRQIRFAGEIGVVSNFDSGTLSVVRRQSDGTVTILGTVTVGSGPIGLDLRLNTAGNIEVLSTGFNDHTYTLTVLSPTGSVIGTPTTRPVPEGGLNPVHAVFVNEQGTRISISCNGSGEVLIFDVPTN